MSAERQEAPLKHTAIARTLEREIRTGKVRTGRQLPGEQALAARFEVSRNTIRQALSELSTAGLIATRTGRGSFVTYDGEHLAVQDGWAMALRKRGIGASVELLRLERVTEPELAITLGEDSSEFIAIDRVRRLADGTGVSFERSRLSASGPFSDLPERGLRENSITATLFAAGVTPVQGEQWLGGRKLTSEEASALDRSADEWFLRTTRVTRTSSGEFLEFVESSLDPAHFQLHLLFE